jgi:uncharacterized protein CbrC (UPF0167 family)
MPPPNKRTRSARAGSVIRGVRVDGALVADDVECILGEDGSVTYQGRKLFSMVESSNGLTSWCHLDPSEEFSHDDLFTPVLPGEFDAKLHTSPIVFTNRSLVTDMASTCYVDDVREYWMDHSGKSTTQAEDPGEPESIASRHDVPEEIADESEGQSEEEEEPSEDEDEEEEGEDEEDVSDGESEEETEEESEEDEESAELCALQYPMCVRDEI